MTKKKTHEQFLIDLTEVNPNIIPLDTYINAQTKINFKCLVCGYEWKAKPNTLLTGHGCPLCKRSAISNSLASDHEEFIQKLQRINPSIIVLGQYERSNIKIQCQCSICGHEWSATPNNLLRGSGCPKCQRHIRTSFPEQAVYFYVKKLLPDAINGYSGEFSPSEIDIYLPSIKTAIEYDGVAWHKKSERKEVQKYDKCKQLGIKLIRIRETPLPLLEKIICDQAVKCEFTGRGYNYSSLDSCICEILGILNVFTSVNTEKDSNQIKEQYFGQLKKNSLQELFPKVAAEWDQRKNGKITPAMVVAGSKESYNWKCSKCGYEWKAEIYNRTYANQGCPKCAGNIKLTNDEFLQRLKTINQSIIPLEKYDGAEKKLRCKCVVCGNEWRIAPIKLLTGRGCPNCARINSRKTPEQFENEVKKINPHIILLTQYIKSTEPVRCKCSDCGYEWNTAARNLIVPKQCPKCAGTARKTHEEFVAELKAISSNIEVLEPYKNAQTKIKCRCNVCGTIWSPKPNTLLNGEGCPTCHSSKKTNETFMAQLSEKNPNIEPLEEYRGVFTPITFKCTICGHVWSAKPANILKTAKCPICKKTRSKKNTGQTAD